MEPGFLAGATVLLTTGPLSSPFLNEVILGSFIISIIAVSKYPERSVLERQRGLFQFPVGSLQSMRTRKVE